LFTAVPPIAGTCDDYALLESANLHKHMKMNGAFSFANIGLQTLGSVANDSPIWACI
jgi:hypothetical protein